MKKVLKLWLVTKHQRKKLYLINQNHPNYVKNVPIPELHKLDVQNTAARTIQASISEYDKNMIKHLKHEFKKKSHQALFKTVSEVK